MPQVFKISLTELVFWMVVLAIVAVGTSGFVLGVIYSSWYLLMTLAAFIAVCVTIVALG